MLTFLMSFWVSAAVLTVWVFIFLWRLKLVLQNRWAKIAAVKPDTRAQVRKHTNEMEQWLIDEGDMHDMFELTTWDESTPLPEITAPVVQPGFISPQYIPQTMMTTGGTVGSPYARSNESYYHDQARCTCGVCSHLRLRHEQQEAHARNVVAQMRNGLINSATAQQIAQMPMDAYAAQREFLLRQMREMAMIPSHTYARLPKRQ